MKKNNLLTWLTALLMVLGPSQIFAKGALPKIHGSGHVIKSSKSLPAFNKISAQGIDVIRIMKSENGQNSLVIETDDNIMPYINAEVRNGVLRFSYRDIKPTRLRFYVMTSSLNEIKASGVSDVRVQDSLSADYFAIHVSGASQVRLMGQVNSLNIDASGASDVFLTGNCNNMKADLSGAADLKAAKMKVDSAYIKASGAASARVNTIKYLYKNVSGVANVRLANTPDNVSVKDNKTVRLNQLVNKSQYKFDKFHFRTDTTRVNIGKMRVEVVDGDSTKVTVGNHVLVVGRNGNVWWGRRTENRFKGHWGGVDFGLNGYVNGNYNANFAAPYDYLALQYEKSFSVALNLYEQSFPLNKNNTIGLITGLGLTFNDYRFSNPVYLDPTQNHLSGYYIANTSVKKSKLSVYYADIPLILEFQTKNQESYKRFFFSFGVIANVRLRSHSKIYFNEANKPYALEYPMGNLVADTYRTPDRDNRNIVKNINSFDLNPFRFDATVRLGFRWISLYATYALSPMFQAGKGPDLRQWNAGITLIKW